MSYINFKYHKDIEKFTEKEAKFNKNQYYKLKKIIQPEQRTPEWFKAREGKITASTWGPIVGLGKGNLKQEAKKKVFTEDNHYFEGKAVNWGKKYEEIAQKIYERRNNVKVKEFGLLPHHKYDFLGASPDGITNEGIMLEIKCPFSRQICGEIPSQYWAQMQGQLECCRLKRCDYLEVKLEKYDDNLGDDISKEYLKDLRKLKKIDETTMELGCVMKVYTKDNERKYIYPPKFFMTEEEILNWKKNYEKKYTVARFTFFKVTDIFCTPVFRDKKWFKEDAFPKLTDFWKKVLLCRKGKDREHKWKLFVKHFGEIKSRPRKPKVLNEEELSFNMIKNNPIALFGIENIIPPKKIDETKIEKNIIYNDKGEIDLGKTLSKCKS